MYLLSCRKDSTVLFFAFSLITLCCCSMGQLGLSLLLYFNLVLTLCKGTMPHIMTREFEHKTTTNAFTPNKNFKRDNNINNIIFNHNQSFKRDDNLIMFNHNQNCKRDNYNVQSQFRPLIQGPSLATANWYLFR